MSEPKRIQRKRTKGWRMPEGAVYVGRPTRWGSPFRLNTPHALARVPAIHHPDQGWEYEGRVSADGMRHDYFHPASSTPAQVDYTAGSMPVTIVHVRYMTATETVEAYRAWLHGDGRWPLDWRRPSSIDQIQTLRGRDLACWCPLNQPCHADVLLELANGGAA